LQGFELELGSALGFSPAKDSASGEASGAPSFAGDGRQEAGCASCPAFDLGLSRCRKDTGRLRRDDRQDIAGWFREKSETRVFRNPRAPQRERDTCDALS